MTHFRPIWLPLSQFLHKLQNKVKESGINKLVEEEKNLLTLR